MLRRGQWETFPEEKIDLPEIEVDIISTLEKEYSFASKEVYTQRVD